jgi:hypothetical protein
MAKPPGHAKIIISGTLGSGTPAPEIWSNTLCSGPTPAPKMPADMAALGALVGDAWQTHIAPLVSNAVKVTRVRVAQIGGDGYTLRGTDGSYLHGDDLAVRNGADGSVNRPAPQVTCAVTTHSTFAGPTGRGRFFLPMPTGAPEAATLLIPETKRAAIEAAAKNFLVAVNNACASGGFGPLVIASGGSVLKGFPPQLHPITGVSVGQAFDTIRARRNALLDKDPTITPLS